MSEKKAYPLRISAPVLEAIQRWADDELRSLNAQIEYVLRESLRQGPHRPVRSRQSSTSPSPDKERP